jgi:hypothetical protein
MANLNKTTAEHAQSFSGAFGNNSVAIFKYTLAAAQINDVVYLGKLPKYAYVHSVKLINAALGSSTTVDVGYLTAEVGGTLTADDNYWLSAIDTSGAATTASIASAVPVVLSEETFVTATVEGAAATGVIYVVVEYLYENN